MVRINGIAKAVCERALDCVLFIDEAHQLISSTQGGSDDTFGREAVGALNKYMEDHRDRICVIAAGYPDEMERLFSADPGLRSRFTHKIVFEDYSAQEMLEIFKGMVTEGTLALADEAGPVLRQIFEEWERHPPAGFANARDVRNLYQATRTAMSDRLVSGAVLENLSAEELKTIVADDIKSAVSPPT